MPSELSISPVAAILPQTTPSHDAQAPAPPAEPAQAAPIYPNPSSHIDPATNLLVVSYRNEAGAVINQMPTSQQLAAYLQDQAAKT